MPFDYRNISVLAYANGFTLWHYKTNDTPEAVFTEGYFNGGADMFANGDMLTVTGPHIGAQFYIQLDRPNVRLITLSFARVHPHESSAPPASETPAKAAD